MLRVTAYSRLHFGLLNPIGPEAGRLGPALFRGFGGAGMMIAQPDLSLSVESGSVWSAEGPLAERTLAFAQRIAAASCRDEQIEALPPRRLRVERVMPAHAGLGSGTQLGLAVARALAASWGLPRDLTTLARRTGRGLRSALGAHGFEQGGFLVESGKSSPERLSTLAARQSFPEDWRLIVVLPAGHAAGLHGGGELEAFARLRADSNALARTETLCRLVLLGLLPALVERDLDAFGEALFEFNVRAGEVFVPAQGGAYASPRAAELVQFVRGQDIRGVGQSSWGPALFAVVADLDRAEHLAAQLRRRFALPEPAVWTTPACNHGAIMQEED